VIRQSLSTFSTDLAIVKDPINEKIVHGQVVETVKNLEREDLTIVLVLVLIWACHDGEDL